MKVWITGENSFLSKNFVRWSKEHDNKYEVVNSLDNSYYDYFRSFKMMSNKNKEINIFDPSLYKLIDNSEAELIIHHAGIVGTDNCVKDPEVALRTNIEGTYKIIDIAKRIGIPLIFTSTSVCYKPTDKKITEDSELEPQTIYGMTKLSGELLLKTWMKNNYVTVVPAMLFGAYDLHSAANKLIMSGEGKIADNVDIALDPEFIKPFMYVDNYLDGLDLVIENFDKLRNQRINIAPTDSKPFDYVINYVTNNMGLTPSYTLHPDNDYLRNHNLDNIKLKSLGWRQRFSLEEGLNKVQELIKNA